MASKTKKTTARAGKKPKAPKPKTRGKARDNFPDVPDNHSPKLRRIRRRR
jgi:hypothetical protein